ncbi:MAG TPA: hypothetical protein VHN16_06500 [Streptosporangiaceae bacterium]|nr:hypothetical protein [Streptosporangiaceae bacterium]
MSAGTSVPEQAARLVERAQKVALCLDFDGTLSPIVEDPQAARPLPAFSAVAQLAGQGYKGLRVAVRSEEAPPQLLAEADLIIEGSAGVLDFLQQLAA